MSWPGPRHYDHDLVMVFALVIRHCHGDGDSPTGIFMVTGALAWYRVPIQPWGCYGHWSYCMDMATVGMTFCSRCIIICMFYGRFWTTHSNSWVFVIIKEQDILPLYSKLSRQLRLEPSSCWTCLWLAPIGSWFINIMCLLLVYVRNNCVRCLTYNYQRRTSGHN